MGSEGSRDTGCRRRRRGLRGVGAQDTPPGLLIPRGGRVAPTRQGDGLWYAS